MMSFTVDNLPSSWACQLRTGMRVAHGPGGAARTKAFRTIMRSVLWVFVFRKEVQMFSPEKDLGVVCVVVELGWCLRKISSNGQHKYWTGLEKDEPLGNPTWQNIALWDTPSWLDLLHMARQKWHYSGLAYTSQSGHCIYSSLLDDLIDRIEWIKGQGGKMPQWPLFWYYPLCWWLLFWYLPWGENLVWNGSSRDWCPRGFYICIISLDTFFRSGVTMASFREGEPMPEGRGCCSSRSIFVN